jgi:serine/threonine protein kinase
MNADANPTWGISMGLVCLGVLVLFIVAVVLIVVLSRRRGGNRPAAPRSGPPAWRRREHRPPPAREEHCLECATILPPDSPHGLCPQCLLKGALSDAPDQPPEERKVRTTPYPGPFEAPGPVELAPHFPQLEILELIGQGGMGAVYKARQVKLDRLVALKILPSEWGKDPAFAERFAREARTLARLNHPHIVAVHDFGESGGLYYLVMEYVDGLNLRQTLEAGRFRPEEALAVVPQVCDALQYAHEEGVVHRDIKPENILLDRRGRVKIADFGLAKLLNRPRAEFTLTGSRQVMGTLDYMAPEQRQSSQEIDHRADIYSLGVVFYEMLTGELPLGRFAAPSEKAGVDARLDQVVFRALETDPGRRYQSISEVKTDVESIAGGQAPPAREVRPAPADRARTDLAVALHQVRGPSTGLLICGLLAPLPWAAAFLILTLIDPRWLWWNSAEMLFESDGGPPPGAFLIMMFFSLIPAGILVAGALKMRRCESYELALIASILAMTPFAGSVWMLSLPMGLWALLVLFRKQVRAGFALSLPEWLREGIDGRPRARLVGPPPGLLESQVRRRLAWPAAGLLLAGILQCVGQVLLAIPLAVGAVFASYDILHGGDVSVALQHGIVSLPEVLLLAAPGLALVLGWLLLGLHIGRGMIRAALRMTRLESYRQAVRGSILAMIPCSPAHLFTLPAGIWAFVVLRDLEVEAAFAPDGKRHQFGRPVPVRRPTGPVQRKARSFLESVLAVFVSRPGKGRPLEEDRLPERS